MKKLKLTAEALTVETFAIPEQDRVTGTVRAYGVTDSCGPDQYSRCGPNLCDPWNTPSANLSDCC